MSNDIKNMLEKLGIDKPGSYKNHFYYITLDDSNEYAIVYTKLNEKAVNTEYPNFGKNTNNTTVKVINYFEMSENDTTYLLFLTADFENNVYTLKIGEK